MEIKYVLLKGHGTQVMAFLFPKEEAMGTIKNHFPCPLGVFLDLKSFEKQVRS